jgi:hypothetical protein
MHGNHRQTHALNMSACDTHAFNMEERGVSPVPTPGSFRSDLNQSSSAQNPDVCPFLEENGKQSGPIHTTPLNPRCPI